MTLARFNALSDSMAAPSVCCNCLLQLLRQLGTGLLLLACLSQLSACVQVDMKQVAYQTLRQEDCRVNELDEFCQRTYAIEYNEYERMRQDFLRSQQEQPWRATASNY